MVAEGDYKFRWDFFVSYAQTDQGWAEWCAWQLNAGGLRVLPPTARF